MSPAFILPAIVMFAAAIIALSVALSAWSRRAAPGGRYLALLMAAVALYVFASALELTALSAPAKMFWLKVSYLGSVNIAPLWLLFSLSYSRFTNQLDSRQTAALWLLPGLFLILAATNQYHGWVWPAEPFLSTESGTGSFSKHGAAVWAHAAYAYLLFITGVYFLLRTASRSPELFREQVSIIIAAVMIPWLGNILYLFNLSPLPGVDPTPLAILLTGVLIAWDLFSFQMLDLMPVARELMLDSLSDGVIVLDSQNRIVDLNPVARQWIGISSEAIGLDLFEALKLEPDIAQSNSDEQRQAPQNLFQLQIGQGEAQRIYSLTISPLGETLDEPDQPPLQGSVVLVHDITHERAMLDAEHQRSRQMELLNEITHTALSSPDLQTMLQTLADRLGELFEADGAYLTLWEDDQQRALPAAAYGAMREIYRNIRAQPNQKTLTEYALELGKVLVISDTTNSPYIEPDIAVRFPSRSLLVLPLMADNRKMGAAIVAFILPRDFTPDEIALGDQAASQIALAMLKVKLIEIETRRAAQMTALQSVSHAVASSLDLKQIMHTVVSVLHDTFGYGLVSIYLLDGDILHFGAQVGYVEENIFWDIPITQGVIGRTIRSKQTHFIRDVSTDAEFLRVSADITSEICVPLIKEDTVLGALNVESTAEKTLTEEDVNLLITFANQVAVAIENANLFQAERTQRQMAEALFAATRDFTAGLSEEAVLHVIGHHLVSALRAVGCTISRWDPTDDCVVTLLDYTTSSQVSLAGSGTIFALVDYPATRSVIDSRQPLYLRIDDPSIDLAERAVLEQYGNETVLMLPLAASQAGQIFGIVELFGKVSDHPFSESELDLAQSLVAQAAIAIENAHLYAEVQRLSIVDELTGLYNRRGLFQIGRREFERAARFDRPLAALFLDIDHFKVFNDAYSYAVGDQALRLLTSCLDTNLREIDLAGRYGGEEFVVLLPETDLASAGQVAERLRLAIEGTKVNTGQEEVSITVSIGACLKTPDLPDLDALIDRAGQALHEAKKGGRNRVAIL
ncbi:MAG: diguanylate cyclase [Anaerolineales bacterium]|nr:diguanylate cyclase [Anaerolineales bacterium]